jgi:hypothetical protein
MVYERTKEKNDGVENEKRKEKIKIEPVPNAKLFLDVTMRCKQSKAFLNDIFSFCSLYVVLLFIEDVCSGGERDLGRCGKHRIGRWQHTKSSLLPHRQSTGHTSLRTRLSSFLNVALIVEEIITVVVCKQYDSTCACACSSRSASRIAILGCLPILQHRIPIQELSIDSNSRVFETLFVRRWRKIWKVYSALLGVHIEKNRSGRVPHHGLLVRRRRNFCDQRCDSSIFTSSQSHEWQR